MRLIKTIIIDKQLAIDFARTILAKVGKGQRSRTITLNGVSISEQDLVFFGTSV